MKKQLTKFAQVAGIMLALAFSFSCSSGDDDGGDGGGGYNGPLVGRWYTSQEMADLAATGYDYPAYEFKSDGTLIVAPGFISETKTTYTATANTITIYNEPAYYTISGTVLTITDPKGTGMTGLSPGTYYKPSK